MGDVIKELEHAIIHVTSPNEVAFDQKDLWPAQPGVPSWEDPIKWRFGAYQQPDGKFYCAAISMDVLTRLSDGTIHRREVGFIKLAVDEMVDQDGDPVPMIAVFLAPHIDQTQDDDMDPPVFVMSRKGIRFNVPVLGALSGTSSQFRSDDGRYLYNVQGDPTPEYPHGRIVQYDTQHPAFGANPSAAAVAILKPTTL